jgi:death-on-curing family protein
LTARVRFLSVEQVIAMHDTLVTPEVGLGVRASRVDAAMQAVKNSYYEGLHELAAAYAVYVIQEQAFADGSKRTGAAAMLTLLEANGESVHISDMELVTMTIELQRRAEGGESAMALIGWIAGMLAAWPVRSRPRRRGRL